MVVVEVLQHLSVAVAHAPATPKATGVEVGAAVAMLMQL
jgi:hypothetical protein